MVSRTDLREAKLEEHVVQVIHTGLAEEVPQAAVCGACWERARVKPRGHYRRHLGAGGGVGDAELVALTDAEEAHLLQHRGECAVVVVHVDAEEPRFDVQACELRSGAVEGQLRRTLK